MLNATFTAPCPTTFCRLDELGLEAVGQRLEPDRAVIECGVVEPDPWCRACVAEGVVRDTVIRRLAHEPFGHRPTTLLVRVRRYRCAPCGLTWREDTDRRKRGKARMQAVIETSWNLGRRLLLGLARLVIPDLLP